MSEEQKTTNDAPTGEQKPGTELLDELQALGQQLATAVKSLWESEDSRKLRQQIGDGFADVGRTIESAIQSAQESEATKQFTEQVKGTVDRARKSDISGKVEEGLLTGLRELNAQVSKLVSSLEQKETPKAGPEDQPPA